MESNMINNLMEATKNVTRIAANVTSNVGGKPQQKPAQEKKTETTNQPHNQTVEVKLGNTDGIPKLHEKKETHIHKVFPDGRELSERECEVEKLRLKQESDLRNRELDFNFMVEEHVRADRKEREEYERKERKEREERNRRRNRNIIIGCSAAVVVGAATYYAVDRYLSSRYSGHNMLAAKSPETPVALNAGESSVK